MAASKQKTAARSGELHMSGRNYNKFGCFVKYSVNAALFCPVS